MNMRGGGMPGEMAILADIFFSCFFLLELPGFIIILGTLEGRGQNNNRFKDKVPSCL